MGPSAASPRVQSDVPKLTRFEILRRVGEGGGGLVYEAIDRERNARVALKMLRVLDGEMLFRLKEECRALQDIEHPNLIRLFELVSDEGVWFFTMELVDGTSFLDYVTGAPSEADPPTQAQDTGAPTADERSADGRSGSRLASAMRGPWVVDEAKLRASLAQLARGLVALHAAGKMGRDIKPSNVLVARDGRVVVLDFGLVRDAVDASPLDSDAIVGTVLYMAPEQAAAEELGPAADWYSVGAVLYQCLTGRRPFEGTAMDVLERKMLEDPPRPRDLAPCTPEDLDALCMELLARDPSMRPSGADVLRRLEDRSITDRPARPVGPTPFVGRAHETSALAETFARTQAGSAATILVEGESGVGKSALVRRFTKGTQEDPRALVLSGRC